MKNKRNKTTGHLKTTGHFIVECLCSVIFWIDDHKWDLMVLSIGACVGMVFVYTKLH